ncbi:penicillin acylase family protein [Streptomyces sp. SID8014]|uniref:penicillin acylase family protein n=1 Tax=Streptomyces sp. SID8014 TaxID=2706097 RepID=UPI001EF26864|nr:penicillin acylase family protein [Streptomyces sp. SID8014]
MRAERAEKAEKSERGGGSGRPVFALFRDDWGIPHVRAGGARDLAYAQGYVTALDRAWQLHVERHRVLGTSAAFLGADSAGWDGLARRTRLADTARRCYERLDAGTAAWVAAYAAGVCDAFADGVHEAAPEFARTGSAPEGWEPWLPLGVWLSTHLLFAGFPAKLWRGELTRRLGADAVPLFATDGPGTAGSNGWLVTGDRTASGAALLAGDPHRFIEDPGVYQQIHLATTTVGEAGQGEAATDVVGLAVPGVPGLAHFGHTGQVAWAITNAMADYQDLYRERLRRTGDTVEAYGPGGWEEVQAHTETYQVAGGEPVTVEVVETARGTVVVGGPEAGPLPGEEEDAEAANALALRHHPRVSGRLGFETLPALLTARTVAEVSAAVDHWVEPVNVLLAADTEGGLLHRAAGFVPRRPAANRLGPVPAWEPGNAWQDEPEPLPEAPAATWADPGLAVMANERGLAAPLGTEFAPPYRADRIRALLTARTGWRAGDMAAVHTDTYLASARPLLALLARVDTGPLGEPARRLRERLLAWDRHMAADSVDAARYAAFRAEVVRLLAAHPALAELTGPGGPAHTDGYPSVFRPWLFATARIAYALESLLTGGPVAEPDRLTLVARALEAAAGEDAGQPWGALHRLAPWQAVASDEQWPAVAGDHDCVLSTSSLPGVTHLFARGPAARYVWDLARRDDSLWAVPFGASGVPGDPHARDQLPRWSEGGPVPVVTDFARLRHVPLPTPSDRSPAR